jgi:glyoxylase-like metal-dependent hydrolase (beta-lactamase superfamily II)
VALKVQTIITCRGLFEENCHVVYCENTREAVVVDPGSVFRAEGEELVSTLRSMNLNLRYIINTHGHLDHIGANAVLKSATSAEILVHELDAHMLTSSDNNGAAIFGFRVESPEPSRKLRDGDVVAIGEFQLKVLHTPGHTPGSICLEGPGFVLSGDTLMGRSIGRTDLPGGSLESELLSIRTKLFVLPDDTVVYPGHGSSTTIGDEKKFNPFLQ